MLGIKPPGTTKSDKDVCPEALAIAVYLFVCFLSVWWGGKGSWSARAAVMAPEALGNMPRSVGIMPACQSQCAALAICRTTGSHALKTRWTENTADYTFMPHLVSLWCILQLIQKKKCKIKDDARGTLSGKPPHDGSIVSSFALYLLIYFCQQMAPQFNRLWIAALQVWWTCSSPKWLIILSSPQLSKTTPSQGETVNELLSVVKVRQYCCRLSAVTSFQTFNLSLIISQWDKSGSRKGGKVFLSLPVTVICLCVNICGLWLQSNWDLKDFCPTGWSKVFHANWTLKQRLFPQCTNHLYFEL